METETDARARLACARLLALGAWGAVRARQLNLRLGDEALGQANGALGAERLS